MGDLSNGLVQSYYHYSRQGQVFAAQAIVTAPVVYSTAAGTGGPLLWNNTTDTEAVILSVTCVITTASAAAVALGLTGGTQTANVPIAATTAIDSIGNMRIGGVGQAMTVYRTGTPSAAGTFFLPLVGLGTGAVTLYSEYLGLEDLGGLAVVPPGSWISVAASATATSAVCQIGMVWLETKLR